MSDKRILICLFTYNRRFLLENAVRSIDHFFPVGDRLILDDASSNPEVGEYLEALSENTQWQTYVNPNRKERTLGGFYSNVKYAIGRALEQGYDYCLFIEDDAQFVWEKPNYVEYLNDFFSKSPDALQLCPWFPVRHRSVVQKGQGEAPEWRMEYVPELHAYRTRTGMKSTGFLNLDIIRNTPDFEFIDHSGTDLPCNSGFWLSKGYRAYMEAEPTVAVMPWVESQIDGKANQKTKAHQRDGDYMLRPLSTDEIDYLRHRPPENVPYQEYFNLSPENVQRPHWHRKGAMYNFYFACCARAASFEGSILSPPIPAPVVELDQPSVLTPHPTHLKKFHESVARSTEAEKTNEVGSEDLSAQSKEPARVRSRSPIRALLGPRAPRFFRAAYIPIEAYLQSFLVVLQRKYGTHYWALFRDYVGFLRLRCRLRMEQRRLPYRFDYK